ncbi:pentapeptide repeat-containing protein [uncultured Helicobacter sp.]|uniref:pentapeptide repeat-containing protein n=1 Tax=uncultured Helicobacter sp. TaxID=175537 RepID=UPI0025D097A9|nr:pentapeptide repeat-containing protein [uncultured Helicobacter sp.]
MAIDTNGFLAYLNSGNTENDFSVFLNSLADDKNYQKITRNQNTIIVNERVYIQFSERLENKHFNLSNITFNAEVTFQGNFEGLQFVFDNTHFKQLNIFDCKIDSIVFNGENYSTGEFNISNCEIKTAVIDSNIQGNISFMKCKFDDFNMLNAEKNIDCAAKFIFNFCEVKGIANFMNFKFRDKVSFKMSIFRDNIYFNNSQFYDSADFHECEFEKTACFYGVTFHNKAIPNFSQAIFKENLNFVNVKCNFEFKDLKALIENDDKTFSSKVANDFRDSFRIIKNALVKDNNLLEAQEYHKMELYCKELELQNTLKQEKPKNKLEEIKKNNNINYKVWLEGLLLLVYRYTSDHHTNLVRIINVTVSMIGLYGLLLYSCSLFLPFVMTGQGFAYYISFCAFFFIVFLVFGLSRRANRLYMILTILLSLGVFMLLFTPIFVANVTYHTILIGLTSLLYVMLLIGYFASLTPKRWVSNIVHTFTYICFFAVFTTLPQLINPFLGIFKSDSIYNVSHFENQLHQLEPQELINIANTLNNQTQFDPYALFVTDTNQAKQIIRDYKETILKTPSLHIQQNPKNISQMPEVLQKAMLKDFVLINTIKSTSVLYSIILLLCIFSLQKTARKNSIIPH